jgi:flagellar FliJ protein
MQNFTSLITAIHLAESRRDQALAVLQQQRGRHQHALGQMDQLQQYAHETESRWTRGAQIGTTPELLHHHYQFMGRLNQAVILQQDVLATSRAKIQAAEAELLQTEFRVASLKLVLKKRQAEQVQREQRREQKQMDEFAAMQTLRQMRQKTELHHDY